jgi:type II secretory pathway component PulK
MTTPTRSAHGFGLRVARGGRRRSPAKGRRRPEKQRGIAILAVITAIAIALMIVNEFASRTTIDELQARNTLDQTRAHFLARSAVNLGELLLRMQRAIDKIPAGTKQALNLPPDLSVTEFSDQLMGAFGGDDEQVMHAIGVQSMDDVKGLGASIGVFGLKMVPIDGKININCAGGDAATKKRTAVLLKWLFFPFATNSVFDDEDSEGWRRDFETQVEAIIDYVDTDTMHVDVAERPGAAAGSGSNSGINEPLPQAGGEDYGYENLRDRYQPKNNRLDSVGELRLVRGIDDRMWTLFGGAFRVHGGCQISVRGLDDITVIAAVISSSAKPDEPLLRADPAMVWKLAGMVVQARSLGMTFPTIADFTKFIADPLAEMQAVLAGAQEAGVNAPAFDASMFGVPPTFKGIELIGDQVRKVLSDAAPRAFQIEAYGDIARQPPLLPLRRTIRGMWDQESTLQNRRWQGAPTAGAWQWLREE